MPTPVDNGILTIKWSLDDTMAVIKSFTPENSELDPTYIWNMESLVTESIGSFEFSEFYWSPDHNDLYRLHYDNTTYVNRYSLKDHSWTEVHTTNRLIEDGTFKVFNNGQFIYLGSEHTRLFKQSYFAVKVDVEKDTVREILTNAVDINAAFCFYYNKFLKKNKVF